MLLATKFRTLSCVAALFAFGSLGAETAEAGDATYLAADASHCEIFRVLSRAVPGECGGPARSMHGLTRSIRFHAAETASSVAAAAPTAPAIEMDWQEGVLDDDQDLETASAPSELSLAMRIQFHLNSDVLTDEAKASLDNVATVLNNDLMADTVVRLEGHADATGSEDYNLSLSERRARAVQAYLVDEHEVEDWRLPYIGKGESELFDSTQPTSSVNRRVEFTNITG